MYLNELPAKAGYEWFREGIKLFFKNPLKALSIFLSYFFVMMLFSFVPVLGPILPLLLLPGLSVGFMYAGRELTANQPLSPLALLTGFRDYGSVVRKHLLLLGLLYICAAFIALSISALADGGMLMHSVISRAPIDNQLLEQGTLLRATLVSLIAYIPIAALFWFAPTLTAWHNVAPQKALFFSAVSCWRNRGAFFVYAVLWIGFTLTVSSTLMILLHLLGLKTLAMSMVMPISLTLTSMFYCSFYVTYRSCFGEKTTLAHR